MRTEYLNPDTLYKITNRMTSPTGLVMRLCLETGLRVGDAVALPTSALRGTEIHYTAQKTGKDGICKITPELMRDLMRNCDGDFLFPSRKSQSGHMTRQAIWKQVKKAVDKEHIEKNIAPHSARKSYAVEVFKKQGLSAVQKALQHSRVDTTLLYCLSDTSFLELDEKLNARLDAIFEKLDRIEKALGVSV